MKYLEDFIIVTENSVKNIHISLLQPNSYSVKIEISLLQPKNSTACMDTAGTLIQKLSDHGFKHIGYSRLLAIANYTVIDYDS